MILGAGVDESQEVLDDSSGSTVPLEVDQRLAVARAGDLRGFLCIISKVMHVEACVQEKVEVNIDSLAGRKKMILHE